MVKVVVFNSSPWIFLSKLEMIETALELFDKVFIPTSVNDEVSLRQDEASTALEQFRRLRQIDVVEPKTFRLIKALGRRLGKGEAEAIVLAIERDANLVILDDHVARMEAIRLGLEVKGTLGIIRRLIELGRFKTDLKELYYRLGVMGFRIKERLFWEIFSGI